jgi:hypothetical protein
MSRALTDATLRKARPPAKGLLEIADAGCRGLTFRLTSGGVAAFTFRFRDRGNGRSERLTLGRYPALGLREARLKAAALQGELAAGRNPAAHKRQACERSFAALAERYLEEHARRFKRSAGFDGLNLRVHILPHWAGRSRPTPPADCASAARRRRRPGR